MGFKLRNSSVCTNRQDRNGLTYFYCKRKVSNVGISTEPLDLELCPLKSKQKYETEIDDFDLCSKRKVRFFFKVSLRSG